MVQLVPVVLHNRIAPLLARAKAWKESASGLGAQETTTERWEQRTSAVTFWGGQGAGAGVEEHVSQASRDWRNCTSESDHLSFDSTSSWTCLLV